MYQFELPLTPDLDHSLILSEIVEAGWKPVSMAAATSPDSSAIICVYLFWR